MDAKVKIELDIKIGSNAIDVTEEDLIKTAVEMEQKLNIDFPKCRVHISTAENHTVVAGIKQNSPDAEPGSWTMKLVYEINDLKGQRRMLIEENRKLRNALQLITGALVR